MSAPKVYAAIAAVAAELAKQGISKADENTYDKYKFRGIDAVYNHLAPLLPKHGLVVLPRYTSREVVERVGGKGTALFYVTVTGEFDFVSVEDGSKHTIITSGEAMDRGDKATNKAMSAAYKYACFQTFCIPTEGDNDADASSHEVQAQTDADRLSALLWKNKRSIQAITEALDYYETGDESALSAAAEAWCEIPEQDRHGIWIAPTKAQAMGIDPPFTTRQREIIKSTEFREAAKPYIQEKAA